MEDDHPFDSLVELCARLRAPDGCPWDREQTLVSLKAYIIEEAYEVVEGIDGEPTGPLASELGDLLFQIVFASQIARERGWFDIDHVCRLVRDKMVRRHPHVFGQVEVEGSADVVRNWESIKEGERTSGGALDGVPRHLPALLKAARITEKAAARGHVWPSEEAALHEGVELLTAAGGARVPAAAETARESSARTIGELLFAIADRCRALGIDPEASLQQANQRFAEEFAAAQARSRTGSAGQTPAVPEGGLG